MKFATKQLLQIPSHFTDTAALSCETVLFQKSHKFNNTVLKKTLFKKEIYEDLFT